MGFFMGILRFVLFAANIVFAIFGVALIATGTAVHINYKAVVDAIPKEYNYGKYFAIVAIVLGCLIFFIASLGCWGAATESTCLLTTYASILLVLFIIQLAFGIFGVYIVENAKQFETQLEHEFKRLIKHYNDTTSPSNAIIDSIQKGFSCCGASGPEDYEADKIPKSCCQKPEASACVLYKNGCVKSLFIVVQRDIRTAALVLIISALVEFVGAMFACCLVYNFRNEYNRRYRNREPDYDYD